MKLNRDSKEFFQSLNANPQSPIPNPRVRFDKPRHNRYNSRTYPHHNWFWRIEVAVTALALSLVVMISIKLLAVSIRRPEPIPVGRRVR